MTPLEHIRVREGDTTPLPRRTIPALDMDGTWQARADRLERARIDWLNVAVWGAVLLLCAGIWAAILWTAWDGLAAMIDAARAAQGRAAW